MINYSWRLANNKILYIKTTDMRGNDLKLKTPNTFVHSTCGRYMKVGLKLLNQALD